MVESVFAGLTKLTFTVWDRAGGTLGRLSSRQINGVTNPVDKGNWRRQAGIFVALFGLLVPSSVSQTRPASVAGQASSVQLAASSQRAANFTDVTSTLGINFEYAASHTSRKYLIETMGSGVALFDYDNDGRLDIFVVNGTPLSENVQAAIVVIVEQGHARS